MTLLAAVSEGATVQVELRPAVATARCEVAGFRADAETLAVAAPVAIQSEAVTLRVAVPAAAVALTPVTSNCWAEQARLESAAEKVVFTLWPRATVRGRFSVEGAEALPAVIDGSFVDVRETAQSPPSHRVDCLIEQSAWQCVIPAGRPMHLRVAAGDFAPIYLWDLNAGVGAISDAGLHELMRGASIAGRAVDHTQRAVAGATISLVPVSSSHQSPSDRTVRTIRAQTNTSGWFQLTGLEAGFYRVVSTMKGLADAKTDSMEVREGEHSRLAEALVHVPLATLEVVVTPPTSSAQKPWQLRLTQHGPRSGERVTPAQGSVGVNGIWTSAPLQPGQYTLWIRDSNGSDVAQEQIELRGGPERITVVVSPLDVHGRVVAGKEGVAATVQFDDRVKGRRVTTTSDSEGNFSVSFPEAGEWHPQITITKESRSVIQLSPVEIRKPHEDMLTLRVGSGRIQGKVVDAQGRGAKAVVRANRVGERKINNAYSDESGAFLMHSLEPGTYSVEADAAGGFARPVTVAVADDDASELELRLEPRRELSGTVLTAAGGPASGAIVRTRETVQKWMKHTVTDARGMYSIQIDPHVEELELIVFSPPRPVAIRKLVFGKRRDATVAIQLSDAGGRVRVLGSGFQTRFTTPGGATLELPALLMPTFGSARFREYDNGTFVVTLEPGPYVVCNQRDDCRRIDVSPRAELEVNFLIPAGG